MSHGGKPKPEPWTKLIPGEPVDRDTPRPLSRAAIVGKHYVMAQTYFHLAERWRHRPHDHAAFLVKANKELELARIANVGY